MLLKASLRWHTVLLVYQTGSLFCAPGVRFVCVNETERRERLSDGENNDRSHFNMSAQQKGGRRWRKEGQQEQRRKTDDCLREGRGMCDQQSLFRFLYKTASLKPFFCHADHCKSSGSSCNITQH